MSGEVEVVVSLLGEDVLAGRLWSHRSRGQESATFSYEESYLGLKGAYELDPRLPLAGGPQQTAGGQAMFAAFSDCAPDGWGRRGDHQSLRVDVATDLFALGPAP